jgi:hypothetical protein
MDTTSLEFEETLDGISALFLERYAEELHNIPSKMLPPEDSEVRKSLSPKELKIYERLEADEKRKMLENRALARTVAYAVMTGHSMLD